jgi:hypothetical protein
MEHPVRIVARPGIGSKLCRQSRITKRKVPEGVDQPRSRNQRVGPAQAIRASQQRTVCLNERFVLAGQVPEVPTAAS